MTRLRLRRTRVTSHLNAALLVGLASAAFTVGNACWSAPPRVDGAGYAVLARALISGEGYRAIDHPDQSRHGHFPPGYPFLLASSWRLIGISVRASHVVSAACMLGATIVVWLWFRCVVARDTALILTLALAVNWLWARTGSAILSEPFYALLCQLTVLVASSGMRRREGRVARSVFVGVLLAGCLLTRHIAVGLAVAVLLDRAFARRWAETLTIAVTTGLLSSPWVVWTALVGSASGTQAEILVTSDASWADRIGHQLVFYIQRIPDQFTGPVVEFVTVFRTSNLGWGVANLWGFVATAWIAVGLLFAVSRPRTRLVGLIPILTGSVLLVWPYLEAGRFLIPLVPCILLGAAEGPKRLLVRLATARNPARSVPNPPGCSESTAGGIATVLRIYVGSRTNQSTGDKSARF